MIYTSFFTIVDKWSHDSNSSIVPQGHDVIKSWPKWFSFMSRFPGRKAAFIYRDRLWPGATSLMQNQLINAIKQKLCCWIHTTTCIQAADARWNLSLLNTLSRDTTERLLAVLNEKVRERERVWKLRRPKEKTTTREDLQNHQRSWYNLGNCSFVKLLLNTLLQWALGECT